MNSLGCRQNHSRPQIRSSCGLFLDRYPLWPSYCSRFLWRTYSSNIVVCGGRLADRRDAHVSGKPLAADSGDDVLYITHRNAQHKTYKFSDKLQTALSAQAAAANVAWARARCHNARFPCQCSKHHLAGRALSSKVHSPARILPNTLHAHSIWTFRIGLALWLTRSNRSLATRRIVFR